MANATTDPNGHGDLRMRAATRLAAHERGAHLRASDALRVLHDLASSPATAADALALLHELQVHQVELDLQAEELRGSRAELESALRRQMQLYDAAPVGHFTVDTDGVLLEMNAAGAALLGADRDTLLGQSLYGLLPGESVRTLRQLLVQATEGRGARSALLPLGERANGPRSVYARASSDPAGPTFLLTFMDTAAGELAA